GAERHLLVERRVDRDRRLDIVAIDAIHDAGFELSRREKLDELVREQDVNVGREHEPPARAPDADVLRDHLEERQPVGARKRSMQRGGTCEEPVRARAGFRELDEGGEPRPVGRRIPFDDDHLGVEPRPPALRVEAVDEGLEASERMAAVIVVARGDDDAEVRRRWIVGHASRARISRCHPSSRSRAARSSLLTRAHSGAFTYSWRVYAATSQVKMWAFLISLIANPSRRRRASSSSYV